MQMYKSLVKVGNQDKMVIAVNWKDDAKSTSETTVDRLHHIHVLDRSYSMSGHLNQLVENVKQTIDVMSDNDLVSVIWFSGEGEGDILLKGASKSDDVKKLLDTLKRPVGCTCFSEPLTKVNTIIDDLSAICSNFSVTFFTDGETVTRHTQQEEETRIFAQIAKMKDKIMALNTIGYGHWYNQDLLQRMADSSMFGKMIHSTQINEYKDIWTHTYTMLADMVVEKVIVDTVAGSNYVPDILYLSSKTTKLAKGSMELSFLDKKKNQFFLVLDPSESHFIMNETTHPTYTIKKKIPAPTLKNFYYALAYEYYYAGRGEEAIDILAENLHDKYAIDKALNSFTADERASFLKDLKKFTFRNMTRMKDGEAPEGYVPAEDAFCVMDLLKILATTGENFYVPVKDYNRIGLKVEDNFNLFKANDKPVEAPFKDFVFNQQHLNLSIRYMVTGTVQINPRQAKAHTLPTVVDSRIFRNQTIIKDGVLNVQKFTAWLDKATLNSLYGLITQKLIPQGLYSYVGKAEYGAKRYLIQFDLTTIPVINRLYSKKADGIDTIKEVVTQIENLKAEQKVINYYLGKQVQFNPVEKKFEQEGYTAEQIEVLKQHGLNAKLDYQGIDNKAADKNENDFYESRLLEMKLKGWSSLPKVEEVIQKAKDGKKINEPGLAMLTAIEVIQGLGWDTPSAKAKEELEKLLAGTKNQLFDMNVELNTLKMAKVLTGGWWEGLDVDGKGNFTYENLVVKSDRVKKFF
jgi:hypothetical protein